MIILCSAFILGFLFGFILLPCMGIMIVKMAKWFGSGGEE